MVGLYNKNFDERIIKIAKILYKIGVIAIIYYFGMDIFKNTYLLTISKNLNNLYYNFDLPFYELIFSLIAISLSVYLTKTTELYEENRLTI